MLFSAPCVHRQQRALKLMPNIRIRTAVLLRPVVLWDWQLDDVKEQREDLLVMFDPSKKGKGSIMYYSDALYSSLTTEDTDHA